jgi:hypothetical protein
MMGWGGWGGSGAIFPTALTRARVWALTGKCAPMRPMPHIWGTWGGWGAIFRVEILPNGARGADGAHFSRLMFLDADCSARGAP